MNIGKTIITPVQSVHMTTRTRDEGATCIQHLARLAAQRRVFGRLDWWAASEWAGSDARAWTGDAAMLALPSDIGASDAIAATRMRVAWLRWCAIMDGVSASAVVRDLFAQTAQRLSDAGIGELWCIADTSDWIHDYLGDHGFEPVDRMLTFRIADIPLARPLAPGVTLRPATLADLDAICALDATVFDESWRYPPAIMQRAMAQTPFVSVAVRDGDVIGYQCALLNEGHASGHIVRLAVAEHMRGQGIARALLADVMQQLHRAGCRSFTLNTQQTNRSSQAFYARLGFRLLTDQPDVLRKRISTAAPR
jgi:ribosomal protein S18 acetylase RimI-like enzyme